MTWPAYEDALAFAAVINRHPDYAAATRRQGIGFLTAQRGWWPSAWAAPRDEAQIHRPHSQIIRMLASSGYIDCTPTLTTFAQVEERT